jgi:hypothetical protein
MLKLLKTATPFTAFIIKVPASPPPPGLVPIAMVTRLVASVTRLPNRSWIETSMAGVMGLKAALLLGCTLKASFVAAGVIGLTVVLSVAVLFAVLGSISIAVTLAVLETVPAEVGVTTISTVALAPTARLPRLQVRMPPECEQPCEAETKFEPEGVSTKDTPVTAFGPLLVIVSE